MPGNNPAPRKPEIYEDPSPVLDATGAPANPQPGPDDAFEITESMPMFLEDQGIEPDGGPYDVATVVDALKALFSTGVHFPQQDGELVTAGISRPENSDGYRVLIDMPGHPFWLASRLIFTGNANGVAYEDFIPAFTEAVDVANAMLHAWNNR
jgi:hypothetical protein